jgi:hypothetical protein
MKSHIYAHAGAKILRLFPFVLPAILALGALAASAQQNSLVGQWRGASNGITLTVVIQPNGQYSQVAQSSTLMTQQSGPYKLIAPNTVIFSVTDWAPKTMPVYHPTGTQGGYYTNEPMAKPPDVNDSYVFNGPNTLTLTDQIYHVSITMTRVH